MQGRAKMYLHSTGSTGLENKLAVRALSKLAVNAGVLSSRARRVSSQLGEVGSDYFPSARVSDKDIGYELTRQQELVDHSPE